MLCSNENVTFFVKSKNIIFLLSKLNSSHLNIQFEIEVEKNKKFQFFNVLLIRNNNILETTVYRKFTNIERVLSWNSWAVFKMQIIFIFKLEINPRKRSTLKSIISRAYLICSKTEYLQKELDHVSLVFGKHNFPRWVIKQLFEKR